MSKQRNILVVDDERTIREVVRRYLELEGYLVTEAETGPQALSILQSQTPDLIVLDIMLPGVDGFSITRRLRHPSESNPLRIEGEVPIILLTARTNEVAFTSHRGLELGADDYVTKPFSPRELVARVKTVLRRSATTEIESEAPLGFGKLHLDPRSRSVNVAERPGDTNRQGIRLAVFSHAAPAPGFQTAAIAGPSMGIRVLWR